MKKHTRFRLPDIGRAIAVAIAAIAGFLALYIYRLGSLQGGLSANEQQTRLLSAGLHEIARNPLDMPYKLAEFAMLHAHNHLIAAARLPSVAVALLATIIFAFITYRWHGRRTALFASLLFATSGWLLHVGRLGSSNSLMLLVLLGLLAAAYLANTSEHPNLVLLALAIVCGGTLFVPAAIWFVLLTIFLMRSQIAEQFDEASIGMKIGAVAIVLLCIAALGQGLFRTPNLAKLWLGWPTHLPSLTVIGKQWLDTILYLFVRGPADSELWLPHAPILSAFGSALCLLGIYFYATHRESWRTRLLGGFVLIASVLVALNGAVAMSFVVPIAYLLAATGIAFLLHKWLSVFPVNPVARIVGVALIALAVIFTITYHTESYFVAWRYAPATHRTFSYHP